MKTAWEPWDLAWSPDGKILAFIGHTEERGLSFEIYLLDPENKNVKQLTDDREGNIAPGGLKYTLTWSPDGSRLIYGTSRLPGQKVQGIEITAKKQDDELKGAPAGESRRRVSSPFVLSPLNLYISSSHTPALSECPYREGNDGTLWVYRTYGGNIVSALQYRDYTGRMTEDADPNPPHKSIYDPVAAADETSGPGLGQHSANHWAMGLHNERLGEPVDVPNVQWSDDRQILVYYYTGVPIQEGKGSLHPFQKFANALSQKSGSPPAGKKS